MATMTSTPRQAHAAGRRADVYGMAIGYEAADPWNRTGSTALQPGRQHHRHAQSHGWIGAALRNIIIKIAGH